MTPRTKLARSGYRWRFSTRHRRWGSVDLTSGDHPGERADDIVIDVWFHMEWLSDDRGDCHWWMRVGDAQILVCTRGLDPLTLSIERGIYGVVLPDGLPRVNLARPLRHVPTPRPLPQGLAAEVGRVVDSLLTGLLDRDTAVQRLLDRLTLELEP